MDRGQIVRLTAAKTLTNASLRWIPFFFVTLEVAFDTTTATLVAVLGVAEMTGLATLLIGGYLDRGHEKTLMLIALGLVGASGVIALGGSVFFFAASVMVLVLGTAFFTSSGHAWISARVPFDRRARIIGTFEASWAFGLLVGAPTMALLIRWFGWRGPFLAMTLAAPIGALLVYRMPDTPSIVAARQSEKTSMRLTTDAWILVTAGAAVAVAGFATLVVIGTWLDDDLGVSTGGIGLVAMAFGTAELVSSSSSALLADRFGKRRTTQLAMLLLLAGLVVVAMAETSLLVGALGIVLFFLGFEYGIVTSFSLVSEAMPSARGRCITMGGAVGTVARGAGAILAGQLYRNYGINGPIALSAVAAALALVMLSIAAHRTAVA